LAILGFELRASAWPFSKVLSSHVAWGDEEPQFSSFSVDSCGFFCL
jgi:hypothetical protein